MVVVDDHSTGAGTASGQDPGRSQDGDEFRAGPAAVAEAAEVGTAASVAVRLPVLPVQVTAHRDLLHRSRFASRFAARFVARNVTIRRAPLS
jgi:hypothetical protein